MESQNKIFTTFSLDCFIRRTIHVFLFTSHSDLTNLCFIVCYLVKTECRLGSEFSILYILSAKSKGYSDIKIVPLAKTMGGTNTFYKANIP